MTVITSAAAAEAPSTPASPRRRRSPASPPPPFARLFLLVAISVYSSLSPPFVQGASGNTVEVQDDDGSGSTYVYHESHARSSTYEEYYRGPEENGTAFVVTSSDVPVSILRYNDDVYLHGETPINRGDVHVIVKGNCSRMGVVDVDGNEFGVNVTYGNETLPERDRPWHREGDVSSVNVGVSPYDTSSNLAFLKASTFFASWRYYGGWFPPQGVKCPEDVSETSPRGTGGESGASSGARRAIGTVALATMTSGLLLLFSRDARPVGGGIGGGRYGMAALTVLLAIALSRASEYQQHRQQQHASDAIGGSPVIIKRATQAVEGGPPSEEENCVVNVEILVDGCAQPLRVSAPAVRVLDVAIRDQKQSWPSSVPGCGPSQHTALLTFPDENVDSTRGGGEPNGGMVDVTIPRLLDDVCMRAVMGRPFIESSITTGDEGGRVSAPIQATARFIDATRGGEDSREWSRRVQRPSSSLRNADDDPRVVVPTERVGAGSSVRDEGERAKQHSESDAHDWVGRGLGEHSSVASFAIHAVALMSNGAPPNLVRDALRAALDEVDHAVTSFGVASELMTTATGGGGAVGGIVAVEPGPLPPTNHGFGRDLVGLAVSTAREGCVEETLSALEVAHEADDDDLDVALRKTLERIAMDEARHSALAWRTVGWACGVDPTACDAVVEGEVFGGLDGVAARRGHSPNGAVATGWKEIYRTLVPVVLAAGKGRRGGDDGDWTVECDGIDSEDSSPLVGRTVVERVVEAIIGDVLCASGTESLSAASE